MSELIKDTVKGLPWYMYVTLAVSAGLGIAGFIIPPMGVIDPSILKFTAEIIGGTWLFNFGVNLPKYIAMGASIRAAHGNTTIEVSSGGQEDKKD